MTLAQKIIKYLATAFAIFLIVTIISAMLSGGYAVLSAFGLIHTDKNIVTEELNVISNDEKEISTLKVELGYTDLEIKTGDNFEVWTNNPKISFTNNSGSVKIEEKHSNWFNNNSVNSYLIIYIPKDMIALDEISIETDAGKINIEKITTQGLFLQSGAGDVYVDNVVVTKEAQLEGGIGKTELRNCEINNLEANLGIGEFIFNGKLVGNNELNSGIGAIDVELVGDKENYTVEVDKGIGNVILDGKEIETDRIYGTGETCLDIDGGVGKIEVSFIDSYLD